jgi:hypothetical protein
MEIVSNPFPNGKKLPWLLARHQVPTDVFLSRNPSHPNTGGKNETVQRIYYFLARSLQARRLTHTLFLLIL